MKPLQYVYMGKKKVIKGSVRVRRQRKGIIWLSRPSTLSIIFLVFGVSLLSLAITLTGIPVVWMVWYRVSPETSGDLAKILQRPIFRQGTTFASSNTKVIYQPPIDPLLGQDSWILIPAIGVKTQIQEAPLADYETALRKGVWRVPDFGDPYSRDKPTILAAHRFGYLAWTNKYRQANSFLSLPKLKLGDKVELIWKQRRYIYQVYGEGEGEEINDYQADLILYTCKFLESPIRIFKYAKLVKE
jgi:sortase (surface protein transpeptidase)